MSNLDTSTMSDLEQRAIDKLRERFDSTEPAGDDATYIAWLEQRAAYTELVDMGSRNLIDSAIGEAGRRAQLRGPASWEFDGEPGDYAEASDRNLLAHYIGSDADRVEQARRRLERLEAGEERREVYAYHYRLVA
jgi:hypothetical protein